MRIGLFSDTYLPDINGVVSSVDLLKRQLEKLGNEVYVICTYPGLLKVQKEGNIIRLPGLEFKKLYGYSVATPFHFLLIDDIRELNLDIIHVHTEFGVGIFAQMCADRLHIPLVRTYHTTYEDYTHYVNFLGLNSVDKAAKKLVANISKLYGEKCMRLISPSHKTKEMLIRYGIKTPIEIIPTGTELKHFDPSNTSLEIKKNIRAEFDIKDGQKMILYVGRIAKEKSIDMLLDAFSLIKKEKANCKLVIIGGGPDLESLTKKSHEMDLDDYVIFADKRPFKDIPAYYHSADAFVSASTTETQGMTYIEALASGLVIFARRDDCVKELLDENINGYYFDDAHELKDKIITFTNLDDNKVEEMSSKGVDKVKIYDADIFGERVFNLYKDAMKEFHDYYKVLKTKLKNDLVVLELENGFGTKEELQVTLDDFYDIGIRKGNDLPNNIFDELKDKEIYVDAYNKCLSKLARKDRTVKQMYDYLCKEYDIDIKYINKIIDRLIERKLLDDELYAKAKVETYENLLFSTRHMINQLRKDGVPVDIIANVINKDDDAELNKAIKLGNRHMFTIRNKSLKAKKQTIIRKLMTEGFDYEIAMKAVDNLDFSDDIQNEEEVIRKEARKTKLRLSRKYKGTELRNRMYNTLYTKGFSSENIYAILSEMEDKDE